MIKISTFIHSAYFVTLFTISLSASATSLLETNTANTNRAPDPAAMNHQAEESNQGGKDKVVATDISITDGQKKEAEEVEQKKQCAMARKNLGILKKSQGVKTFRTSEGEIVRYSPDKIKQMIQDN
ncbi:MAG TPA: hypothetical protein ENI67_03460, partial [Gammaproteobacteria bacterium]|nr:hypothetical protein [Gammaproteobacteria bacterium]